MFLSFLLVFYCPVFCSCSLTKYFPTNVGAASKTNVSVLVPALDPVALVPTSDMVTPAPAPVHPPGAGHLCTGPKAAVAESVIQKEAGGVDYTRTAEASFAKETVTDKRLE